MPKLYLLVLLCLVKYASGQELPLYNGPEYTISYLKVSGHPFFLSDSLLDSQIQYDGILYANVKLGYNIADGQLYIRQPQYGYNIQLLPDKIDYFVIRGRRFEKVEGARAEFYEIIYSDEVKVYVNRFKKVIPPASRDDVARFREYAQYFTVRAGKLSRIRNLRAVKPSMRGDSLLTRTPLAIVPRQPSPLMRKAFDENKVHEVGGKNAAADKSLVSLAGYIRDSKTGESIIGANVSADSLGVVMTDQFGYYSLKLRPGRHTVKVSGAGINTTVRQIELQADGNLDVETSVEVGSLKTVIVMAEKSSKLKSTQMGVEKLTIQNIRQVPVVFGEADVLRVVTTLPGVTSVGEAGTGFNVRGGSTDQNLILFNESTIYNPAHLFGFFSAFNPDIIKSVELYKSSIPEKYGGRLSSVLDISSREGNSRNFSGSGGIGPLTSKLTLEGPLSFRKLPAGQNAPTTFIASARGNYSNWLLRNLPDARYRNSRAAFSDMFVNITHAASSKNSIYISGYLSNDRFRLNNDTTYAYGNRNLSMKWKHVFNNKLYSVISGGYDRYGYSVDSDDNPVNAFKLAFTINQAHFRTNFTYSPSNAHLVDMGVQAVYYKLNPGSLEPLAAQSLVTPKTLQQEQALETAIYVGDRYNVSPALSLNAGIRYSFFQYLGPSVVDRYVPGQPRDTSSIAEKLSYAKGKIIQTWHAPELRLSARYALNELSSVKLGFTTTRQYIHMLSNTTIISPTDTWKLSDNNIRPQQGWQLSGGYYRNLFRNAVELSTELYYRRMRNVLDYKSGARLLMNEHIAADVISTNGKSYGAELMIRKSAGKINGWLSYTYSRTMLQQSDSLAGERINGGRYYPSNADKPHNLNVISNYRFTHRFSLSVTLVYSTGRPITIPIALFDMAGSQRVFYSERNQYRIPDYLRADASFTIEGNHRLKQKVHNSWSFGFYNLTARQNPYSVYFKQENGIIRGYQLSIFGTIIPFVTYNFRF